MRTINFFTLEELRQKYQDHFSGNFYVYGGKVIFHDDFTDSFVHYAHAGRLGYYYTVTGDYLPKKAVNYSPFVRNASDESGEQADNILFAFHMEEIEDFYEGWYLIVKDGHWLKLVSPIGFTEYPCIHESGKVTYDFPERWPMELKDAMPALARSFNRVKDGWQS